MSLTCKRENLYFILLKGYLNFFLLKIKKVD